MLSGGVDYVAPYYLRYILAITPSITAKGLSLLPASHPSCFSSLDPRNLTPTLPASPWLPAADSWWLSLLLEDSTSHGTPLHPWPTTLMPPTSVTTITPVHSSLTCFPHPPLHDEHLQHLDQFRRERSPYSRLANVAHVRPLNVPPRGLDHEVGA